MCADQIMVIKNVYSSKNTWKFVFLLFFGFPIKFWSIIVVLQVYWTISKKLCIFDFFSQFCDPNLEPYYFYYSQILFTFKYLHSDFLYSVIYTAQKTKFFIKDFASKYDQIRRNLWTCSHLLKKFLIFFE